MSSSSSAAEATGFSSGARWAAPAISAKRRRGQGLGEVAHRRRRRDEVVLAAHDERRHRDLGKRRRAIEGSRAPRRRGRTTRRRRRRGCRDRVRRGRSGGTRGSRARTSVLRSPSRPMPCPMPAPARRARPSRPASPMRDPLQNDASVSTRSGCDAASSRATAPPSESPADVEAPAAGLVDEAQRRLGEFGDGERGRRSPGSRRGRAGRRGGCAGRAAARATSATTPSQTAVVVPSEGSEHEQAARRRRVGRRRDRAVQAGDGHRDSFVEREVKRSDGCADDALRCRDRRSRVVLQFRD